MSGIGGIGDTSHPTQGGYIIYRAECPDGVLEGGPLDVAAHAPQTRGKALALRMALDLACRSHAKAGRGIMRRGVIRMQREGLVELVKTYVPDEVGILELTVAVPGPVLIERARERGMHPKLMLSFLLQGLQDSDRLN